MLTSKQIGKGRRSTEVWLQAKVYLYVSEVCQGETWQTEEPVLLFFFFLWINHTYFTTTSLQANYKRSPINQPTSYTAAAESINSIDNGIAEPKNPTITCEQYLYNYIHTFYIRTALFLKKTTYTRWGAGTPTLTRKRKRTLMNLGLEIYDKEPDICLAQKMS